MIDRIKVSSPNSVLNKPQSQPKFTGFIDGFVTAVQKCEEQPMLNVSVLDVATCIGPRTLIEGQTNAFAGLEALRRESSGLIINCLIPGLIVAGIAKAIQGRIMGSDTKMGDCLADEDTLKKVAHFYKSAEGKGQVKVKNTLKSMLGSLEGMDGSKRTFNNVQTSGIKKFKNFKLDDECRDLAKLICDEKSSADDIDKVYKAIVSKTSIAENIRFSKKEGFFSQNLESLVKESSKVLKEFVQKGITEAGAVDNFVGKANKLVNIKSGLGMLVIIPLAIMAQPINRWITAKTSGKKGAPIYKDFKESKEQQLSKKDKSGLFTQKIISVASMVGVALLSMGGKTSWKKFQFKGLFPTMDQARLISTVTFASRMLSSEDKNELREATVRDIATFSAFYFLGDYVAKAVATGIQKAKGIKLINNLKPIKTDANVFEKLVHWAKNTSLKSSKELINNEKAAKARTLCQLANLGFSLLSLGVLIPKYTRHKTDKKREEELKRQGVDKKEIDKYYPHFQMKNAAAAQKTAFKSFSTAN